MNTYLLAQGIRNPVLPPDIGAGTTEQGQIVIGSLVGAIVGGLFVFAFILAFIYLILGGFTWITSGGDKGKLEEARNKITHAIIGIIIVSAAWAIMTLIGTFLGISFPEIDFPTLPSLL